MRPRLTILLAAAAALFSVSSVRAESVLVATAANFAAPLQRLAKEFSGATGHDLKIVTGSTGTLAAQVRNGAPFMILLAADQDRPAQLEAEGFAVAGTLFTYALGRLALWGPDPRWLMIDPAAALADPALKHLAIANPDLAPYGRAAEQALTGLGLWEAAQPKLVRGEDVGQTLQFIESGNAELGFVALSRVIDKSGSRWEVPEHLYAPIRQQAVLLNPGKDSAAARAFLEYLRSDAARAVIRAAGYGVEG